MPDLLIRPATASDLPDVIRLLADDDLGNTREAVPASGAPLDPRYATAFAALEADPHQLFLVGLLDGVLVACLQLSVIPGLSRLGSSRGQGASVRRAAQPRGQGLRRPRRPHAGDQPARRRCSLR